MSSQKKKKEHIEAAKKLLEDDVTGYGASHREHDEIVEDLLSALDHMEKAGIKLKGPKQINRSTGQNLPVTYARIKERISTARTHELADISNSLLMLHDEFNANLIKGGSSKRRGTSRRKQSRRNKTRRQQ